MTDQMLYRTRCAFGAAHLRGRVLDFGCQRWQLLEYLDADRVASYMGVDLDREALEFARERARGQGSFLCSFLAVEDWLVKAGQSFDSACVLDVLEHMPVYKREGALREIYARMVPHGTFAVTVPGASAWNWMDTSNWKFVFPRTFRVYSSITRGREATARTLDATRGLIGDVDVEQGWHHHFDLVELVNLVAAAGFVIQSVERVGRRAMLSYRIVATKGP